MIPSPTALVEAIKGQTLEVLREEHDSRIAVRVVCVEPGAIRVQVSGPDGRFRAALSITPQVAQVRIASAWGFEVLSVRDEAVKFQLRDRDGDVVLVSSIKPGEILLLDSTRSHSPRFVSEIEWKRLCGFALSFTEGVESAQLAWF